jgi:hypothetical protein
MNYTNLLNQNRFVSFLKTIASVDKNPTIVTSAKQILFDIQGNNNIANYPYYTELYKKYKFQLKVVKTNQGLKVALYSWIGDNIKYIGTVYRGENPYVVNTITYPEPPAPPAPPTPVVIIDYITDDQDNYITTDIGEYLFASNTIYVNPPDPI